MTKSQKKKQKVPRGFKETKIGLIPFDWTCGTVCELLERVTRPVSIVKGKAYQEIGIRSHCRGIFYKPHTNEKQIGNKRVFWVEPNCFIFNIIFAWEHAIALTTDKEKGMIASHRFPMYRSANGQLHPGYVYLFFSSPRGKYNLGIASPGGAGRNRTLGQEEFKRLRISVPPMKYQKLAIEIIDTWDKAIDGTKKLIAAKKKLKKGLMQQLLSGKRRFHEYVKSKQFQNHKNIKIPKDWHYIKLNELGEAYTGLTGKSKNSFGRGKPYIPYVNIFNNYKINLQQIKYVEVKEGEKQNKAKYGDIFFTISSETPEDVGMASVLLDVMEELYLNSFCFGFRLNSFKVLLPEFAQYCLRAYPARKEIYRLAQGSIRYNLSKTQLLKIHIPIPSTGEQKQIASLLTALDNEIKLLLQQQELLKQQKRSLVQRLLAGTLRVNI